MNREEAKKILEEGGLLHTHVWTFSKCYMGCSSEESCCENDYSNVEEALDSLETYRSGRWDEVYE